MKDSSFGNAALRSRTINVGVNLLGEWLSERERERRAVNRYGALLSAALFVAVLGLPPLWRAAGKAGREATEYGAKVKELDAALAVADRTKQAAQPGLVVKAMCDRTEANFGRLMGQMGRILSAGNARTALSNVKVDVIGGEAHFVVQADAEEDGAADAFARNAGDPGAKVDAIVSTRPSTLLSKDGVGFAYEKRIGVGE